MRLLKLIKRLYKNPAFKELKKQKADPEEWNKLVKENKALIKAYEEKMLKENK